MSNSKFNISIIIVNYKSWKPLELCLKSIAEISSSNLKLETIIIDNCSNDHRLNDFKKKFSDFSFFVNSGNNGFANGCNLGAKKASGEYLLFLNPDTIVTEAPIYKMVRYLEANINFGIVSCQQKNETSFEKTHRFFPDFHTLFGFLRALNKNYLFNKIKKKDEVLFPDWVSGAVVCISRRWFDKINGWNEDYWMYFEDVDFSKKVRNSGGEVALLTDTEIIHNHGGSSRINIKTAVTTKTEVIISKHVYIRNHFTGIKHFILQFLVVSTTFFSKLIIALLGLIFFFILKFRLDLFLFFKVLKYYIFAIINQTWLSDKSMNHQNKK
ncbi:glycosyltransferase family 2 protein [uncultured Polaribacter sp.]|uniref:glycosyltransferase family 2 protein n=1 Tax=uncultured Polaribacter sp. TaxID=174711 RepID=UPI002630E450|nr:glycosyltransferase family 2 protein [uncultured Polaribacter sp.]